MKKNRKNWSNPEESATTRNPNTTPTVSTNETGVAVDGSRQEVAERAYFIYLNQGSPMGYEIDHWLQAEAEVLEAHKAGLSVT